MNKATQREHILGHSVGQQVDDRARFRVNKLFALNRCSQCLCEWQPRSRSWLASRHYGLAGEHYQLHGEIIAPAIPGRGLRSMHLLASQPRKGLRRNKLNRSERMSNESANSLRPLTCPKIVFTSLMLERHQGPIVTNGFN